LTSDKEIVEESTEVTSDDTEDSVVSEDEEYQVGNATTSENEAEENEGTRSYVGRRGRLGGRRIIGGRGWRTRGGVVGGSGGRDSAEGVSQGSHGGEVGRRGVGRGDETEGVRRVRRSHEEVVEGRGAGRAGDD